MAAAKIEKRDYNAQEAAPRTQEPKKTRKEALGEKIVSLVLKEPKCLDMINDSHCASLSSKLQAVIANLRTGQEHPDTEFVNYLTFKAEVEEDADAEEEIKVCLKELESIEVRSKLDSLSRELKVAEANSDTDKINNLINEFHQLTNKLLEL